MSVAFTVGPGGDSLIVSDRGAALVLQTLNIERPRQGNDLDPLLVRGRIDMLLFLQLDRQPAVRAALEREGLEMVIFDKLRDVATDAERLNVPVTVF